METIKAYVLSFAFGAFVYWSADVALHWMVPEEAGLWILLTFAVPVVVGIAYKQFCRRPDRRGYGPGIPISMLLGIWAIGPLALAVGMLAAGGKFLDPGSRVEFLKLWTVFPLATFIMATYSGSLGRLP